MHNIAKPDQNLNQDQVDSGEDSNQCEDHEIEDALNQDGNIFCGCFTLLCIF